jgi:hypothetical protein
MAQPKPEVINMNTLSAITLATSLALTGGCASTTTPDSPVGRTVMLEKAYSLANESTAPTLPDPRPMCAELGKAERMVRQHRSQGISLDLAKAIVVTIIINDTTMGDEQTRDMVATGAFMVIDHVYSGHSGNVYSRCMNENWPLALYIETL